MRFLRELRGWNIRYGEWWMVQWQFNNWLSFGIHIDWSTKIVSSGEHAGTTYGPYIDIHFLFFIVSVGRNPVFSGALLNESSIARGGKSVPSDDDLVVERIEWKWRAFVEMALILLLLINIYATYWRIRAEGWLP